MNFMRKVFAVSILVLLAAPGFVFGGQDKPKTATKAESSPPSQTATKSAASSPCECTCPPKVVVVKHRKHRKIRKHRVHRRHRLHRRHWHYSRRYSVKVAPKVSGISNIEAVQWVLKSATLDAPDSITLKSNDDPQKETIAITISGSPVVVETFANIPNSKVVGIKWDDKKPSSLWVWPKTIGQVTMKVWSPATGLSKDIPITVEAVSTSSSSAPPASTSGSTTTDQSTAGTQPTPGAIPSQARGITLQSSPSPSPSATASQTWLGQITWRSIARLIVIALLTAVLAYVIVWVIRRNQQRRRVVREHNHEDEIDVDPDADLNQV